MATKNLAKKQKTKKQNKTYDYKEQRKLIKTSVIAVLCVKLS